MDDFDGVEEDSAERRDPGAIVDPETGLPRVLSRKCSTCIYRPGNLMHLMPGRRESMEQSANKSGVWIICHSTLSSEEEAICRGYYDVNARNSAGIRLALFFVVQNGLPGLPEIEPPAKETEER